MLNSNAAMQLGNNICIVHYIERRLEIKILIKFNNINLTETYKLKSFKVEVIKTCHDDATWLASVMQIGDLQACTSVKNSSSYSIFTLSPEVSQFKSTNNKSQLYHTDIHFQY